MNKNQSPQLLKTLLYKFVTFNIDFFLKIMWGLCAYTTLRMYLNNPNSSLLSHRAETCFYGFVFIWRILIPNFPRHNNTIVIKYVAELIRSMMEK